MSLPAARFRVHVDPANPGQFFACCAMLELSARLEDNAGAQGWFENGDFCVASKHDLAETLRQITRAELKSLDAQDITACPIWIGEPFNLRLDWWKSDDRKITDLKVWAGTMEGLRMARAMQQAMRSDVFTTPNLFNVGAVARDPDDPAKKVEPFYFDARRGPNAHSRDVGFAPNDLGLTTIASPAVEFLCLIGLQRCLPMPVKDLFRHYDYFLWPKPTESSLLLAAVAGLLPSSTGYRFESWFRTSQRKHKAFLKANKLQPI
jgi:CRISPR-associated protein Csb3